MSGLFNSSLIKKTVQNAQARGSYDSKKPQVEAGKQLLTFSKIESRTSKKDNEPMVVITFEKEGYRPFNTAFKLAGRGGDIGKQKYIEFLHRGFSYELQECNTLEEAVDQAKQFLGDNLQVAVRHRESLYAYTDNNNDDKLKVVSQPEYWYCSLANDQKFQVNQSKLIRELTDEDKERLVNFEALNGNVVNEKINEEPPVAEKDPEPEAAPTVTEEDEDDNLPF